MTVTIDSSKTAINRTNASVPTRALEKAGRIKGNILDYGCGKGKDVEYLLSLGYNVVGYDPYHRPGQINDTFDTIICNYVLNVIDDTDVRKGIIDNIFNLLASNGRAYITVRNDVNKSASPKWQAYKDGYITTKNTYQVQLTIDDLTALCCHPEMVITDHSTAKYTMIEI